MRELLVTNKSIVYPWNCDHHGHMNVMFYVGKFSEAAAHLLLEGGITPSYLRTQHRGMAALQHDITYKRELLAGDVVEVRSQVLEVRNKVIRFQHQMLNIETGEVAALLEGTAVHMDAVKRKACPFPELIRQKLQRLILDAEQPANK